MKKKLILIYLLFYSIFASSQIVDSTFLIPKLPSGSNSINPPLAENPEYIWSKTNGGWVAKNQKMVYFYGSEYLDSSFLNTTINKYINDYKLKKNVNIKIKKKCDCFENFILFEGENLHDISVFPDPENSSAGAGSRVGPRNNSFENDENVENLFVKNEIPQINNNLICNPFPLKIALLDNGIIDNLIFQKNRFYSQNQMISGVTNDKIWGLNFTNNNINNEIFTSSNHGTIVANIISNNLKDNIKIIPFKVIENNEGNLFDVLCGMLHAQKMGVKIINTSFGFSGKNNLVLDKILNRLRSDEIFVVSSAGNEGKELAQVSFDLPDLEFSSNKISQYPAMYCDTYRNVISVSNLVRGNFSSKYISLMVIHPVLNINTYTSFSTAYVTNVLANNFYRIKEIWYEDFIFQSSTNPLTRMKEFFFRNTPEIRFDNDLRIKVNLGKVISPN